MKFIVLDSLESLFMTREMEANDEEMKKKEIISLFAIKDVAHSRELRRGLRNFFLSLVKRKRGWDSTSSYIEYEQLCDA